MPATKKINLRTAFFHAANGTAAFVGAVGSAVAIPMAVSIISGAEPFWDNARAGVASTAMAAASSTLFVAGYRRRFFKSMKPD